MGWKQIGNHLYFYRSRREGGRVRSEYLGRGEFAFDMARIIEMDRLGDQADREAERTEREAETAAERELDGLVYEAGEMAGEALRASGLHYHRGEWRKKRGHR